MMVTVAHVIGVDCAVDPRKTGLVFAHMQAEGLVIKDATLASKKSSAAGIVSDWLTDSADALICLDAPLGWPRTMEKALAGHRAGKSFGVSSNSLFRRATDDFVHQHFRKRPLDVGADRIARTAVAALELLGEVSERLHRPIPLAWGRQERQKISAIEVYPAATRLAWNCASGSGCLDGLHSHFKLQPGFSLPDSEHVRDAVVCVIAGKDFLLDLCFPPTDQSSAEKEGWIWVARPQDLACTDQRVSP